MTVVYSREDLFHYKSSLPIVNSALLHNKCEEFTASTKLSYYIVVIVILIALVIFKHIWVIDRLKHAYLISKVRFTCHIALFNDFKGSILVKISMKDPFDAAKGALAECFFDFVGLSDFFFL
jgi:hypothetical protein